AWRIAAARYVAVLPEVTCVGTATAPAMPVQALPAGGGPGKLSGVDSLVLGEGVHGVFCGTVEEDAADCRGQRHRPRGVGRRPAPRGLRRGRRGERARSPGLPAQTTAPRPDPAGHAFARAGRLALPGTPEGQQDGGRGTRPRHHRDHPHARVGDGPRLRRFRPQTYRARNPDGRNPPLPGRRERQAIAMKRRGLKWAAAGTTDERGPGPFGSGPATCTSRRAG